MEAVRFSDEIDGILGGDLTAALAYVTPAGGCVVTAVAPIGLHDHEAGTVTFTTSLGFGRKLERLRREPRVALAYHAREHGFATSPAFVLVQGRARYDLRPDPAFLHELQPSVERFLGPPRHGAFWDRWLRAYYSDRVAVTVEVERIASWPDPRCRGERSVVGQPWPAEPPAQRPPRGGTGPRVDAVRAARRLSALAHQLAAFRGADGFPVIAPVAVGQGAPDGIPLEAADGLLPQGGRRAGLLAHAYRPQLIGLAVRQHTGWLDVDGSAARYRPHTATGFRAPPNKTLLLLGNGLLARRGLRRAEREGRRERLAS